MVCAQESDTSATLPFQVAIDGNGNVTTLTDETGTNITARYEYDPFGRLLSASGEAADDNPWRFSTKMYEEDWGLGYWGYRWYSPSLGRWTRRDPIWEGDGININVFVGNGPISGSDGLGLTMSTELDALDCRTKINTFLRNDPVYGEWYNRFKDSCPLSFGCKCCSSSGKRGDTDGDFKPNTPGPGGSIMVCVESDWINMFKHELSTGCRSAHIPTGAIASKMAMKTENALVALVCVMSCRHMRCLVPLATRLILTKYGNT